MSGLNVIISYTKTVYCTIWLSFGSIEQARQEISITLPDGSMRSGTSWETTPMDVAKELSKSLSERIVIAKVRAKKINHELVSDGFLIGRWRIVGPRASLGKISKTWTFRLWAPWRSEILNLLGAQFSWLVQGRECSGTRLPMHSVKPQNAITDAIFALDLPLMTVSSMKWPSKIGKYK